MLRVTVIVVRGVCVFLGAILGAWEIWMLFQWGVPPWPSALWFIALLAAISISFRLPRTTSSRIGFGLLFLFASVACSLMWRRETPMEGIALLLSPLGLGLAAIVLSRMSPVESSASSRSRAA
jgi:hypothetical protein